MSRCTVLPRLIWSASLGALFSACGPTLDVTTASDAELCRDVIHHLCMEPLCQWVVDDLKLAGKPDCEPTALTFTNCSSDDFSFPAPLPPLPNLTPWKISRARVIECRQYLLRQGTSWNTHPACADLGSMFDNCVDLERFVFGIVTT